MEPYKITIDGNKFSTLEEFYQEMDQVLANGWESGHNLDAFNDLISGGFGAHEVGQELDITWLNAEKSREDLGEKIFDKIVDIILDEKCHQHCELSFVDEVMNINMADVTEEELEALIAGLMAGTEEPEEEPESEEPVAEESVAEEPVAEESVAEESLPEQEDSLDEE